MIPIFCTLLAVITPSSWLVTAPFAPQVTREGYRVHYYVLPLSAEGRPGLGEDKNLVQGHTNSDGAQSYAPNFPLLPIPLLCSFPFFSFLLCPLSPLPPSSLPSELLGSLEKFLNYSRETFHPKGTKIFCLNLCPLRGWCDSNGRP
jgi:hypothetical protein